MTEAQYFEVPCTKGVAGAQFSQGIQDYPFSVGAPNCFVPKKSYFKIRMQLLSAVTANTPLTPQQLTAYADNAAGNLFDNVYFRGGQQDISSIIQYSAQASALKTRINNMLPWLRSMGAGTAVNEASFGKRLVACSAWPLTGAPPAAPSASVTCTGQYEDRDVFRPYDTAAAANFATATVAITVNTVAAGAITNGGVVLGANGAQFLTGMPLMYNGVNQAPASTGGPVLPGDILVANGVQYVVQVVTSATGLIVSPSPNPAVTTTTDWFIVRSDTIRAPASFSEVYAIWQPPLGIFDWSEELGAGDYRIQLNPSSNFLQNAVETKDPNWQAALPYNLVIQDVKFYAYTEKRAIPDGIRELYLNEVSLQTKTYATNLQFSVPPSTSAITIFIQDQVAGTSPIVPPSMFKLQNNADLTLNTVQVTYANLNKPSTNWQSNYSAIGSAANAFTANQFGVLDLQQRYHDTYEESGLDIKVGGMETFCDWMRRGPIYHFTFDKDINNKSTEVQINLAYNQAIPSGTKVFIASWFRKTVQLTVAAGLITQVASREV